jgi:hypothetical protein
LKNDETLAAYNLMKDVEPSTPQVSFWKKNLLTLGIYS